MIKTTYCFILFLFLLFGLNPTYLWAQPPGGTPNATSLDCGVTDEFSLGANGFSGDNPTTSAGSCGQCCYQGSDLDGDGDQDVTFSVENTVWYEYCNTSGTAVTIDIIVLEVDGGGSCNVQGAVFVGPSGDAGVIDCGNSEFDEYGSSPGGNANGFSFTVDVPDGECAFMMIDGYGGATCGALTIEIPCPINCTPPTVMTAAAPAICEGESSAINATVSGGIVFGSTTYSWSPTTALSCADCEDPTASPASTTTYTLTACNDGIGNSCCATVDVLVDVTPLFVPDAGADITACQGSSITIGGNPTGPSGSTYSWAETGSNNGMAISGSSTVANPTVDIDAGASGSGTYTVTVTNGACIFTDEVIITVGVLSVDAGADVFLCEGTTGSIGGAPTAPAGATYSWSETVANGDIAISGPSNVANPTVDASLGGSGSATYEVTATLSGCVNTDIVVVTIDQLPTTPTAVASPASICPGISSTLTASGGDGSGTYTWLDGPGGASIGTTDALVVSPSVTTTYYLTSTDAVTGCVSLEGSVTVTVTPAPVADAGSDITICEGDFSLTGSILNTGACGTQVWNIISGTGTFSDATGLNPTFTPTAGPGTYEFELVPCDPPGGCTSVNDNVIVTISPAPTVVATTQSTELCLGLLTNLDAAVSGGTPTPPTIITESFTSGLVEQAIPNNDCVTGSTIGIPVSGVGDPLVGATTVTICVDVDLNKVQDISIVVCAPGGSPCVTLVPDAGLPNGNNFISTCFSFDGANMTTGNAPYTGTWIPVAPATMADLDGAQTNGTWTMTVFDCAGGGSGEFDSWDITFDTPVAVDAYTYSWSPDTQLDDGTIQAPTFLSSGLTAPSTECLAVTVTDDIGCTATDQVCIDIIDVPAPFVLTNDQVCADPFTFSGPALGLGETGLWSVVSGTGTFVDDADPVTDVSGLTLGDNIFEWAITNSCGSTSSQITVTLLAPPTTPVVTNNGPICSAEDAIFTITGDNGDDVTYNLGVGSVTVTLTGGNATVTVSGATLDQTLTLESVDDGNCTAPLTESVTITVTALPADPIISTGAATCTADGTATIDNYDGTFTYVFTPAGPTDGAGGVISGMVPGTSYDVYADNGACISGTVSFTVAPQLTVPADPIISTGAATCTADGTATIDNYDGTLTYVFTPAGPIDGAGGVISGMVPGTSYDVYADNGACISGTVSFTITPQLTVPADPIISTGAATCSTDGTATIDNYDGTFTYVFTPAGPTANVGGVVTGIIPGTSYTLVADDGTCSSLASAAFTIDAQLPTPTITLTPDDPDNCNGMDGSVLVSGAGSGTVTWSGVASGSANPVTLNYTIPTLGAGSYDVFFIDGTTGCQSATESTLLNNPDAPIVDPISSVNNCGTDYTLATITGPLLNSPQYYDAPGGPTGGGNVVPIGTTYSAPTNITLYAYDENGVCTSEQSFTVVIEELPTVTAVNGGNTYCVGDTPADITVDVIGNGPWTIDYTVDGVAQTASGATSPINLGNAPGEYVVTNITDATCTNTASGTQAIDFYTIPAVTAVNGGDDYCPSDIVADVTVDVTGNGPWGIDYTLDGVAQAATGAVSPISLGNTPGVYVVTSVTDVNCAVFASGTQTITINTIPAITLTPDDPSACNGTDGSILVSGTGSGTVTWSDAASGSDNAATLNYTIPTLGAGSYDVFFIDGTTGCQSATESTLLNNPSAPIAPVVIAVPATCLVDGMATIDNYDGTLTYVFTPAGPTDGAGGAITGMISGTSYTVIADDGNCISAASASFTIDAQLTIPDTPAITSGAATCSADGTATIDNYDNNFTYVFDPVGPTAGAGGVISDMVPGISYDVIADNGSCTSTASPAFTIDQQLAAPATPTITTAPAICAADGTATIDNYDGALTYVFDPAGPTANVGGLVTGMTPGTSYTLVADDGTCSSLASAAFTIDAQLPTPTITLTPDDPDNCNGMDGSVLVSGAGSGTVTWSGVASGSDNSVTLNYTIPTLGAGSYDVFFIDGTTGCQSATESTLLNNPGAPIVDPISSVNNCGTDYTLATITGPLLNSPQYYDAPGGPTGGGNVVPVGTTYSAPTNITLYAYDENGVCTSEQSFTVVIEELPTVTAVNGGNTYCAGVTPADITVDVTGNGPWTIDYTVDGVAQTASGAASPINLGNASGEYVVTNITDATCTNTATGTQTIDFFTMPTVETVNGGDDYCPSDIVADVTVDVTGAGPWTIDYTLDGVAQTATGAASPISLGNTPGAYVVTAVTDVNCTDVASGTQTITINTIPTITLTPDDPSACNGTDGSILVSGTGSGTVTWTGIASGSDNTATLNYTIPALGAGSYDVFFIDGTTGCQSAMELTLLNNPSAPNPGTDGNTTVCETDPSVDLFGLLGGTPNTGGVWSPALSSGTGVYNPALDAGGVYTYSITTSCGTFSSIVDVTLNLTADATFNYSSDEFCLNEANPIASFDGTNGGVFTISSGGVIDATNGTIDIAGSGAGTYGVTYSTSGPCPDVFVLTITILDVNDPTITLVGPFCSYDAPVILQASQPGGVWSGTGVNPITGEFNPSLAASGLNDITYTINGLCIAFSTIQIEVIPAPIVETIGDTTIMNGNSVDLITSGNANAYNWTPGTTLTCDDCQSPIATPDVTTTYTVSVEENGCLASAAVTVTIDYEIIIYVPNAFTPDGDGQNDIFIPIITGIDTDEYKFLIFNRWGELIFDTSHLSEGWDGTYKGLMSQQDVYVWKIYCKEISSIETHEYIGHVTLIK